MPLRLPGAAGAPGGRGPDRCPEAAEDRDGFEDEDGCPDEDNDGDGLSDGKDRCPNDAETVNGFEDEDGCPDVRSTAGPEERADRIDLKGAQVTFARGAATLTPQGRQILGQVAAIIRARRLTIRVEVHVPLGTRSTIPAQIAAGKPISSQNVMIWSPAQINGEYRVVPRFPEREKNTTASLPMSAQGKRSRLEALYCCCAATETKVFRPWRYYAAFFQLGAAVFSCEHTGAGRI